MVFPTQNNFNCTRQMHKNDMAKRLMINSKEMLQNKAIVCDLTAPDGASLFWFHLRISLRRTPSSMVVERSCQTYRHPVPTYCNMGNWWCSFKLQASWKLSVSIWAANRAVVSAAREFAAKYKTYFVRTKNLLFIAKWKLSGVLCGWLTN